MYTAQTVTPRQVINASVDTIMRSVRWLLLEGLPAPESTPARARTLSPSHVEKVRAELQSIQRAVDAIIEQGD